MQATIFLRCVCPKAPPELIDLLGTAFLNVKPAQLVLYAFRKFLP